MTSADGKWPTKADRIIKAYYLKIPMTRVARSLRLDIKDVNAVLRDHGLLSTTRADVVDYHARIDPLKADIHEAREDGNSLRRIGTRFNISASAVQNIVGRHGRVKLKSRGALINPWGK